MTTVSVRDSSKERGWEIVAMDLRYLFSPLFFPSMMSFAQGFGFASEFFACDK